MHALMRPARLIEVLATVEDPRVERTRLHRLVDILVIAVLALINGADGWSDMEVFARSRTAWLRKFLPLKNGVPSEDTFRRVFEAIDCKVFSTCVAQIIEDLVTELAGKVVAIDGKTIRRSFDRRHGKSALHVVSAWVVDLGLSLGQIAVEEKSNEITAIPALIESLEIKGATVTIDAMGCQKAIAQSIVDKDADYVLAVKDNHPTLHGEIVKAFDAVDRDDATKAVFEEHIHETKGHGRHERRRVRVIKDIKGIKDIGAWKNSRSIIEVQRTRTIDGTQTVERAHFISSLAVSAKIAGHRIRSHWGIENTLHWSLDITFGEDTSRVRDRCSASNLACLRKLVLSLLSRAPAYKTRSMAQRRKLAGWVPDYAFEVLAGISEA